MPNHLPTSDSNSQPVIFKSYTKDSAPLTVSWCQSNIENSTSRTIVYWGISFPDYRVLMNQLPGLSCIDDSASRTIIYLWLISLDYIKDSTPWTMVYWGRSFSDYGIPWTQLLYWWRSFLDLWYIEDAAYRTIIYWWLGSLDLWYIEDSAT